MNTQTPEISAREMIADAALDAVAGGTKADRREVTLAEYERILARMIADANKR
jgi:hypothetical protein